MTMFTESKPREAEYQYRGALSRLANAEIQRQQQRKQLNSRKEQK
ncbi:hypothetical protein [Pseudomonas syringae group genomosp. 7]|nr:hypothetical protein [Pseudomonas syringae group genomosp. 7]